MTKATADSRTLARWKARTNKKDSFERWYRREVVTRED